MTIANLSINNLRLDVIIGTQVKERISKQPILITLQISVQMSLPIKEDNIEGTLDYYQLSQKISRSIENTEFYLIETLADFILDLVLEEKKVIEAHIELSKPGALISADTVSVNMSKHRSSN